MKKLWNMLRGRTRRDDRGMTFVEVLCAVAILALVGGVIGTVIVVSTRTYRKGISETSIQQEAQLAANNIGNLVKDACSVRYGEPNQPYLVNGEDKNEDGTPKMPDPMDPTQPLKRTESTTELSIITNEKLEYVVLYDPAKPDPADSTRTIPGKLVYREYKEDGSPNSNLQVMANNVLGFSADTTDFKKNKTIKLNITVEDVSTNRKIPMEYTMTSRNDAVEGAVFTSYTASAAANFMEDEVVLVPGETYELPYVAAGVSGLPEATSSDVNAVKVTGISVDAVQVEVPLNATAPSGDVTIAFKDAEGNVIPGAEDHCTVHIRRVTSVSVSHMIDTTNSQGGMRETAGTVYTFTAAVSGNKLEKQVGHDYDFKYKNTPSNYMPPQSVAWSLVWDLNGSQTRYDWTSSQDGGVWKFDMPDLGVGVFADYFQVLEAEENTTVPSIKIQVKEDKTLPSGLKLTMRATSKHALGGNKAESKYYDEIGDPKDIYFGEDMITARETRVKAKDVELVMEPQETRTVELDMKGGLASTVELRTEGVTDSDTQVSYADGVVTIKVGKDEYNVAPPEAAPGTVVNPNPHEFKVYVDVDGVQKSVITVKVCRIDQISIEVKDNFKDNKGNVMSLPTYDFRARFNVTSGSLTDMEPVVTNLIQYKPLRRKVGEPEVRELDKEAIVNTLSSKITWELTDESTGKSLHKDSVICMAGIGKKNDPNYADTYVESEVKGNYDEKYSETVEGKGKEIYQVVNVKPARIEKNASGNWILKQLPEIDISPSGDSTTGLPKNYRLTVTIQALHPAGKVDGTRYNKGGSKDGENAEGLPYVDTNVEASAYISGDMAIETPEDLIVVEPNQGGTVKYTSFNAESDSGEMVIPIQVNGLAVYSMEATISEYSSKKTKIAVYPDGSANPFPEGSSTSATHARTWYLGMVIGEDEVGNHEGRIKVHIDAYGTPDNNGKKHLGGTDFELGVRRVNTVEMKVFDSKGSAKKINDLNKEGGKMTIQAIPHGVGKYDGREFYDIQEDVQENGTKTTRRWEQYGHGAYQEPAKMEWKMVVDGNEKLLKDWVGTYIKKDSISTPDPNDHKASVSFELLKQLPAGTKIRAYSLHAQGNNKPENAETTTSYTKYNKSGKKYDKVYGELEIKESDAGFKRGKNYLFFANTEDPYSEENPGSMIPAIENDVIGYWNCLEQGVFYRYRETGGTYGKYHAMDRGTNSNWATVDYQPMSYLFRPDKAYEIEIVSVLYNKTDKLIYWPLDKTLLEPGRGWKEAGFKLYEEPTEEQYHKDEPNGSQYYRSYSWYVEQLEKLKKLEEVKGTFPIPKCEMVFHRKDDVVDKINSGAKFCSLSEPATVIGSETNPILLNGNNGNTDDYGGFAVDLEISAYNQNTDQQCFRTVVQKKSGNSWITLGYDDEEKAKAEGFKTDSGNPFISIYRTGNAEGLYRVYPVILAGEKTGGKIKWYSVTDSTHDGYTDMDVLFKPEYTTTEESYPYEKNAIYFKFSR